MKLRMILSCMLVICLLCGGAAVAAVDGISRLDGAILVDEDASHELLLYGDASKQNDGAIELTSLDTWRSGSAWYQRQIDTGSGFTVRMDYWAGGGRDDSYGGADGIVLTFAETTGLGDEGEYMGFVPGSYGIELDSYPHNPGDPNGKHIAVIRDAVSNHLSYSLDDRVDDSAWHTLEVTYAQGLLQVFLDDGEVLRCESALLPEEVYLGVSAATGSGYNRHLIRDFYMRGVVSQGEAFEESTENPIILIPGIMGSRLYSDSAGEDQVWPPSVGSTIWKAISPWSSMSDTMTYGNKLYVYNNYTDQAKLSAGDREYGAQETYETLVDHLCDEFGDTRKIYVFSYDFREDNTISADALHDFIEWTGADKVDVICHSMGGLVLSCYVSRYGTDRLGKTVTMGTPYEGAPKLLNSVLNWDVLTNRYEDDGSKGFKDMMSDNFLGLAGLTKKVKASFPSVAQLAPSRAYFDHYLFYQYDHTESSGFLKLKKTRIYYTIDYSRFKSICSTVFGSDNVASAESMYSAIKNGEGLNLLAGYDQSYFVIGINQPTIGALMFSDGDSLSSMECDDLTYEYRGDGTVPYFSSTMLEKLSSIPDGSDRVLEVDGSHTGILSDPSSLEFIDAVLRGEKRSVSNDEKRNDGFIVVRIACPVEVSVSSGSEALSSLSGSAASFASFGRMDVLGGEDEVKMFCLDASRSGEIEIFGTGSGEMDYSIRQYDAEGGLVMQRNCAGVPVTENTVITTDTNVETATLTVDPDGDGHGAYLLELKDSAPTLALPTETGFTDVDRDAYYYDAVLWAFAEGVTTGTSSTTFSPHDTVTRAQAVTFLWRAMGEPEPSSLRNPFADVRESDYFYKAVLWAVEKGVTVGTSATAFSPSQTCSTAHIITFLYRVMEPGRDGWYLEAGEWAGERGLLVGTGTEALPGIDCSRANVVTFLYRELV